MIRKKLFSCIICFIILATLGLVFLYYIPNANIVKKTIHEYDFKYYNEIFYKKSLNYSNLIKNIDLLKLIELRYKYNTLYIESKNKKFKNLSTGNSWQQVYIFGSLCIIRSKYTTTISYDTKLTEGHYEYNRLTLLKKHNKSWYIENDIISMSKINFFQLFDSNNIVSRIKNYEEEYKKLFYNNFY